MNFLKKLYRSFPLRLLVVQLKRKQVLLLFWVALFAIVAGRILDHFGGQFLFLSPEYYGKVYWASFFIMGICFGIFNVCWQVACYNLFSYRFPFLAALKNPLLVFVINNSIIPALFILVYSVLIYNFQTVKDLQSKAESAYFVFVFILGFLLSTGLILVVFTSINRNMISYLRKNHDVNVFNLRKYERRRLITPSNKWDKYFIDLDDIRVNSYISSTFKIKMVRSVRHYSNELLYAVFRQHHITFSFFVLLLIASVLLLGLLMDKPAFIIPAGASALLMFSVVLSIMAAMIFWLKKWMWFVLVTLLLGLNFISDRKSFQSFSEAYGLNYSQQVLPYNEATLSEIYDNHAETDKSNMEDLLSNWKRNTQKEKPKMLIISSTGGGLRASMYTAKMLHRIDSVLGGELMPQTALMTGASAGQIGNTFYRELYYRNTLADSAKTKMYLRAMDGDILNNVFFSLAVNDLFYPWQKYELDGKKYKKDRSFAWEKKFNSNTFNLLEGDLNSYAHAEKHADIPLIIYSPYVLNDGRQLLISSQGLSFLMKPPEITPGLVYRSDAVDWQSYFNEHDAGNLLVSSAIRMNATYPYFMNSTSLPTEPKMQIYDAGYRDNYGTLTASKFIHSMKDWINANTSGVVWVLLESASAPTFNDKEVSLIEGLLNPLTQTLQTMQNLQEYNQDYYIHSANEVLDKDLQFIHFKFEDENSETAISWHLTRQEKEGITRRVNDEDNLVKMRFLREAISSRPVVFEEGK